MRVRVSRRDSRDGWLPLTPVSRAFATLSTADLATDTRFAASLARFTAALRAPRRKLCGGSCDVSCRLELAFVCRAMRTIRFASF